MPSILVCGNGPSVCNIDFTRVKMDSKVMRMTNFFLEDTYYAGKRVDYYIEYVKRLERQYFNIRMLDMKGEYSFDMENVWMTVMFESNSHFPTVKMATPLIQKNPLIAEFRSFYEFYYGQYLTTGLQGVALAVCLGYKEVYLAGFDLFSDPNNLHPFNAGNYMSEVLNSKSIVSNNSYETSGSSGKSADYSQKHHPSELQTSFLKLLMKLYPDTKIFSVDETSPINQYVEIAPKIYANPWYIPERKGNDRTTDWFEFPKTMPNREVYENAK